MTLRQIKNELKAKAFPIAEPEMRYYVIGPYCWGCALDAVRAFDNAYRSGGSVGTYVLHLVNEEAEVSPVDGGLCYNSRKPCKLKLWAGKLTRGTTNHQKGETEQ